MSWCQPFLLWHLPVRQGPTRPQETPEQAYPWVCLVFTCILLHFPVNQMYLFWVTASQSSFVCVCGIYVQVQNICIDLLLTFNFPERYLKACFWTGVRENCFTSVIPSHKPVLPITRQVWNFSLLCLEDSLVMTVYGW